MAELVIARITENGVQTRDLSETFSGQNEIVIKGQQGNAGGKCVATLNGISLSPSQTKGLNCIHVTDANVLTKTAYDFSIIGDDTKFINWINTLNSGIVLMMSHTENYTTTALNAQFDLWGSVGWKYYWNETKGSTRSSFAAILDCPMKKLMSEQFMGHGSTTPSAQISVVYDTFADIGTTGYGDTIVWDENEYESAGTATDYQGNAFIRAKLTDHNISIGETITLSGEFMKSSAAHAAGAQSCLFAQFQLDGKWVNSQYIGTNGIHNADNWHTLSKNVVVPDGVNEFSIIAYRYPKKDGVIGKVYIRDVVVKPAKPSVIKSGMGSFGQWGFITDEAREADKPVATVDKQSFITSSYESLDEEWLPRFNGGYFKVPEWQVTGDFEMSQTISYDYPRGNEIWYRSGQSSLLDDNTETDRLEFGATTVNHTSGEKHFFAWGNSSIQPSATIEYGKPYTYKISVVANKATCYLDGTKVGEFTPTNFTRKFPFFFVGAEGRGNRANAPVTGTVHELNMLDLTNDANSRYYNFVLAGQLDNDRKVPGKSRYTGKYYVTPSAKPNGSVNAIYCGVTSPTAPYGLQEGDEAFITILDAGTNRLQDAVVGVRYKTKVMRASNPDGARVPYNMFMFINPVSTVAPENWIMREDDVSQNANKLTVKVEYIAHPEIDGDVTNIDWVNIQTKSFDFNGLSGVAIPTWKGPGEFSLKFKLNSYPTIASYYLFDGRTIEDSATPCHIYVTKDTGIINGGGSNLVIASVNGLPFVAGKMLVELDTDYHITGYIVNGGVSFIGCRHNDTEALDGSVWDFSMKSDVEDRYYKNVVKTRYSAHSNIIRDEKGITSTVYKAFDLNDWTLFATVTRVNAKSYKFNTAGTPAGIVYGTGLNRGDRYRIEYDIETSSTTEFKASNTTNGSAPLIKTLPIGRSRGTVCYQHVPIAGSDNPGVYIRTVNPKLDEIVKIYKLKITKVTTDGIGLHTEAAIYEFDNFVEPSMRTVGMKKWVHNFKTSTSYLSIPTWTPDAKNFRIRIDCKVGAITELPAPIIAGAVTETSSINIDHLAGTTIRFFGFDAAKKPVPPISVVHGLPVDSDLKIIVDVVDGIATLNVNGKTATGPWIADQSPNIRFVGARAGTTRYNNDITLVDLIDTSTEKCNHRRYEIVKWSSVKPTTNRVPNTVDIIKQIRLAEITASPLVIGWNRTLPKEIGRLKDSWNVDGYPLDLFTTINTTGYSAYLRFAGNKRPFNNIDVDLYSVDDKLVGTFNANQSIDGSGYGIPESAAVADWFSEVNANKKVVFKPKGDGADAVISAGSWVER